MVKKLNLSEAAKEILDANVMSKRSQDTQKGVGNSTLPTGVAYGQKDAGKIGDSPEKEDDSLPDYTKGTPTATPPGATPPVGSEKDGAGITRPQGQPQETMGRSDLTKPVQYNATDYAAIAARIAGQMPPQTMSANPGATFQQYEGFDLDMTDDVSALLEGESLSEEFKAKATTIFEAAVTSRIAGIAAQIEESFQNQFDEAVEAIKVEITEKVDEYLNYMVEEWMSENEVAIEKGLRAEIVEDFIDKLHDLFTESYIDIPEEKVDVVEELAARIDELEESFNTQVEKNIELVKEINEHKKISAIHAVCEGLTQTQVEKMKTLAESVDFTTEGEFEDKLATLKESYFPTNVKAPSNFLQEEVDSGNAGDDSAKTAKSADPEMEIYAKTISKTLSK